MAKDALKGFHCAVLFMQNGQVARHMRFSEFEAFLDGYVGLSDLADTEAKAVFVVVTPALKIRALVFFRLYFDEEGIADASWKLPIEKLAFMGTRGPDLGGGHVQLVCQSRTPDAAYRDALWDPDMAPGSNDFLAIRRAIDANRLGFPVAAETTAAIATKTAPAAAPKITEYEAIPVLEASASVSAIRTEDAVHRAKLAHLMRQQRLRIKTLQGAHQDLLQALHHEYRIETQTLRRELEDLRQHNERLKVANEQLKTRLTDRNEQYLALQAEQTAASANASADATASASATADAEKLLLQEQLSRKAHELAMRMAQIETLEREGAEAAAKNLSDDGLMAKLREQHVFLVAWHPGAGHISLPYDAIGRYFANPLAYVAEHCNVKEASYREWLAHYESPVCKAEVDGKACDEPLPRVGVPCEFVAGRDDRCAQHQRRV